MLCSKKPNPFPFMKTMAVDSGTPTDNVRPDKPGRSGYYTQPAYESILLGNRLKGVDDILSLTGGTVVRSMPGRITRRIELELPGGSTLVAYLKRYEYDLPGFQWRPGRSQEADGGMESLHEWRQILAFRQAGLRTAAPIAAGWQRAGNRIRSFVMTAEVAGAASGYDFWAASNDTRRRALIHQLADLARRLHAAGFIHKDFYLNHIFVTEHAGGLELTLIDLQRALGPGTFRARWRLKDFGSMLFALQKAGAKHAGLLRFFKLYKGRGAREAAQKRFLARALKRAAWVHRRKPKYGEPGSADAPAVRLRSGLAGFFKARVPVD
jgi:hypothetical protein